MNGGQRAILILATILALAIGLFPPWKYAINAHFGDSSVVSQIPARYAFIMEPPKISGNPSRLWGLSIDFGRLASQYVLLILVTAGSMWALRGIALRHSPHSAATEANRKAKPAMPLKTVGLWVLCLCLGAAIVATVLWASQPGH